ncbi:hypothetical protein JCM1393_02350 [Clostridium carnis]
MLYGNNKDILSIEEKIISITFSECRKYVHNDYKLYIIKLIDSYIDNNIEEIEIKIVDEEKREMDKHKR